MISEEPQIEEEPVSIDPMELQIAQAINRRQLEFYKPYEKQRVFHSVGASYKERLLMAGNQCLGPWSPMEMGSRSRRIGEMLESGGFDVRSWADGSRCSAAASPVFLKGIEPMFRMILGNGQYVDVTSKHRVLTTEGWLSLEQLVHRASGLRCRDTQLDSQASSVADDRSHDAPLLRGGGTGLNRLRPPDDVHSHARSLGVHEDGGAHKFECSRVYRDIVRCATVDDPHLIADLCERFEDPTPYCDARWPRSTRQALWQCAHACGLRRASAQAAHDPLSTDAAHAEDLARHDAADTPALNGVEAQVAGRSLSWFDHGAITLRSLADAPYTQMFVPYQTPPLVGGQYIQAIITLPAQPILDVSVAGTECYESGGVIHHNTGKTWSAGAEAAYHATGMYPGWWDGKRFTTPITAWLGSPTSQTTRDTIQRIVMGNVGEWGTGMIPGRSIIDIKKSIHGVADAIETVLVRHKPTGGMSRLQFKSYDQGRIRWQGETIHFVWFDEEPPLDIYSEGKTRTQVLKGFVMMTFTPLLGMSEVVERFLKEKPPGTITVRMGINDAEHYSEQERIEIIAGYPEHEREARANGEPIMGSGRVFPVDHNLLLCQPIQIPSHWPRIAGIDIGWDHPTAVVWLAWDRDSDVLYVYDTYKLREQTPVVHAAAIKARGPWIPVAWPHDGLQHDTGSGKIIAQQYRAQGILMLPNHATHAPAAGKKDGTGGYGTEAGILEMLQRMQTGRWKVFSTCADWIDEYKMYYRKNGLIVKKGDDIMSASRIATMMLRFAKVRVEKLNGPKLPGYVPSDPTMGPLG